MDSLLLLFAGKVQGAFLIGRVNVEFVFKGCGFFVLVACHCCFVVVVYVLYNVRGVVVRQVKEIHKGRRSRENNQTVGVVFVGIMLWL